MSRIWQFLMFFAIVLLVDGLLHRYFWVRLVRDTHLPPGWRRAGTAAAIGLAVFLPAAMILSRTVPRELAGWFAWPAYIWMGTAFILFCFLVVGDVARLGARLTGAVDPERRLFMARTVGAMTGLATAGVATLATKTALAGPRVLGLEVPIARLPRALDGFKIVQLTDMHIGPTVGREFTTELVRRVNELEPDLVAITGDLVDGSVAELGEHVAPLGDLRSRHGTFFVTGNHEYYSGVEPWLTHLESLGIRVLRNQHVNLADGLDLAGVHDFKAQAGHTADLAAALAGRDERNACVLLAHQPKQIHEAARRQVDLQLSGHTHGGQIWPFTYLVYLQQPYIAGLSRHQGTWIYVSRGTGFWGPPMRLAVPSEISVVTLRAGEAIG